MILGSQKAICLGCGGGLETPDHAADLTKQVRCAMARLARCEVLDPDEINIVHAVNRTVRRCFLMGEDPISGKNFDHRKAWIEALLRHFAACFGIDLLCHSILSNHYHLIFRTRPDVVEHGVTPKWRDAGYQC